VFGFTESLNAPFVVESIAIETLAALALSLWIPVDRIAQNRHRLINLATAAEHLHRHDRLASHTMANGWYEPPPSAS
jgi:hypothetical protein